MTDSTYTRHMRKAVAVPRGFSVESKTATPPQGHTKPSIHHQLIQNVCFSINLIELY
jgi:hypothetical protein